ncbi:MAG: hypothetical protein CMN37_04790 [SAR116 cluster bacterium]|nr:hypothetical protein [SAR116 cluster bacterium]
MSNVIELSRFKKNTDNSVVNQNTDLNSDQIKKLEQLRDGIEKLLNTATAVHGEPLGVGLAAGRYAAMKLYQMHGRAETMAFFDSCIQTVEISEDITAN